MLFCVAVVFLVSGGATNWLSPIGVIILLYELIMFTLGVAPVGRLIYVEEGRAEDALSIRPVRVALRPGARGMYMRARLRSLPVYLPALLLAATLWAVAHSAFPGAWIVALLLVWLSASALLYAHLVVVQLYADAGRAARYL